MPQSITVDILDQVGPKLASLVTDRSKSLSDMRYCDLRIALREEKGAVVENCNAKGSAEDCIFDLGVRVIAGARDSAAGYFGCILGSADANNIESIAWDSMRQAHQRARANTTVALLMPAGITAVGSGIFGLWPGASVSIATSQAQNQRNSLASIPGG